MYHGNLKIYPTTTDNSLSPWTSWYENSNFCLVFNGCWLKQKIVTDTPPNRINFFTAHELDTWSQDLNTDFDYDIGFDSRSKFSLPDGSMGKNVIIFGADMSSSVHIELDDKHINSRS